jgi:hypothetical protein
MKAILPMVFFGYVTEEEHPALRHFYLSIIQNLPYTILWYHLCGPAVLAHAVKHPGLC